MYKRQIMLTGDNERTARAIQKRTGIRQVIAQVLPEEKEKKVAEIQAAGHKVAMIGDGSTMHRRLPELMWGSP